VFIYICIYIYVYIYRFNTYTYKYTYKYTYNYTYTYTFTPIHPHTNIKFSIQGTLLGIDECVRSMPGCFCKYCLHLLKGATIMVTQ